MASPDSASNTHGVPALIAGGVGFLAHVATLIWYAASGLVAPGWAVAVLLLIWLALLVLAIYLLRTRPVYVLLVPFASAAIWFGVLSAGEAWLGWTA
jgi:hypothetical protein